MESDETGQTIGDFLLNSVQRTITQHRNEFARIESLLEANGYDYSVLSPDNVKVLFETARYFKNMGSRHMNRFEPEYEERREQADCVNR